VPSLNFENLKRNLHCNLPNTRNSYGNNKFDNVTANSRNQKLGKKKIRSNIEQNDHLPSLSLIDQQLSAP